MTVLSGQVATSAAGGIVNPNLSASLSAYGVDYWPPHVTAAAASISGAPTRNLPVSAHPRTMSGAVAHQYAADYYDRIHIIPDAIALGNLLGTQTRQVSVWNAWREQSKQLTAIDLINASGITVTGPTAPTTFQPNEMKTWDVAISLGGAPIVDATIKWVISGITIAPTTTLTGTRVQLFGWRPDWRHGVDETLEWLTRIDESEDGSEQAIAMRSTPRRGFQYRTMATDVERQHLQSILAGVSQYPITLPVWGDITTIPDGVDVPNLRINCATFARDFVVDNIAVLVGAADRSKMEAVQVASIDATGITIARAPVNTWAAGDFIVPARSARITLPQVVTHFTGQASEMKLAFNVEGVNDYAGAPGLATYRGFPVLDLRPNWSSDPEVDFSRTMITVDNGLGAPTYIDRTGVPSLRMVFNFTVIGRTQIDHLRQILYQLKGRRGAVWMRSRSRAMQLAADTIINTASMVIDRIEYTNLVGMAVNRRDVRIESADGAWYRRITGAANTTATTETLTLDTALPNAIAKSTDWIEYLTLFRLDTDRVEWAWHTGDMDGDQASATVALPMRTFTNDV